MTFTFRPPPGGRIRVDSATAADGPHIWLSVTNTRAEHAAVFIPLDRLEEVIAGLREIARQQAVQPVPPASCQCIAQTTAASRIYCDPCRTGSASEQTGSAA
ncbi:hypothetical protein OS965_02245 [Streptomyces sp. H27-G5]|uniref:hypothetical protein n=1 Tax=Streptomyces sp. H27-G5 TaxID=2996698 RepID=UPI00226EA987|nr:hypothetical protein [Streptomyces sp. H27-G5]MCY0916996.1 hypothetical protein [Streptomyces sp. H27-G5]